MTTKRDQLVDVPERRGVDVTDFECRAEGDTLEFRGYASIFDAPYDVYGGPKSGGWTEIVDRAAFDVTLRSDPDVMFLVNHQGMPLARTKSKTLRLSTDKRGLRVDADLDRRDPDVQSLEVKMGRRDMDEMSFAFRTKRQEWNDDDTERRLLEVSLYRGDVSIVNYGANPATAGASIRSMLSFLEDVDADDALAEIRNLDDPAEQLRAARATLDGLIRELTPAARRPLRLAEARRLI